MSSLNTCNISDRNNKLNYFLSSICRNAFTWFTEVFTSLDLEKEQKQSNLNSTNAKNCSLNKNLEVGEYYTTERVGFYVFFSLDAILQIKVIELV